MIGRVWLMGVSKQIRVKENDTGSFTIQQLVPPHLTKDPKQCSPYEGAPHPKWGALLWAPLAVATTYQEAVVALQRMQRQLGLFTR